MRQQVCSVLRHLAQELAVMRLARSQIRATEKPVAHLNEPFPSSLRVEESKIDCGLVHEGAIGCIREAGEEGSEELGRTLGR